MADETDTLARSQTGSSLDEKRQGDLESSRSQAETATAAEPAPAAKAAGPPPFPDGGYDAWGVVVGASLVNLCTLGNVTAFGVLQDYYSHHQLEGTKQSSISLIGSFQLFILYLVGMFVGRIFDAHGSRGLMLTGTVLTVFGHMMLSLCHNYYQIFLAQGLVIGFGNALCFWPALGAVNHWFLKRRAYAIGVVVAGSSLGGVIFPILYNRMFVEVGFGWAIRTGGFLILVCLVAANFLVKGRFPKKKAHGPFFDWAAYKDLRYTFTTIGQFFLLLGLFTPFFYMEVYAIQRGVDPALAFYIISIANAASLFGRVLPGFLADYYGRFNLLILTSGLSGIFVLAFWLNAHTTATIIAFSAVYGFTSGAVISLQPAVIAQISPIEKIGVRLGMCYGPLSIANLIGTPVAGALFNNFGGSFTPQIVFVGVTLLVGTVFQVAARLAMSRELKAKV